MRRHIMRCGHLHGSEFPSWSVGITPICWFQDLQATIYSGFRRFGVVSRDNVHFWDESDTPVGIMFILENCPDQGGQIGIWSRDNVQNIVGIIFRYYVGRDNVQNEKPTRSASSLRCDIVSWKQTRWAACYVFSLPPPRRKAKMLWSFISISVLSSPNLGRKPHNHNLCKWTRLLASRPFVK